MNAGSMESFSGMENGNGNGNGSASGSSGPKKRVINACLTCRGKKIKCGKEKPDCQNCSRLSIECVWSESLPSSSSNHSNLSREVAIPSTSSGIRRKRAKNVTGPSYSHSPWISEASSKPVLLDHIQHLESMLKSLQTELEDSRKDNTASIPSQNSRSQNLNPFGSEIPTFQSSFPFDQSSINPENQEEEMFNLSDAVKFPFSLDSSPNRIKAALKHLPQDWVMKFLLDEFEEMERACLQGLTWRLIRIQFSKFSTQVCGGTSLVTDVSEIDLSFLGLLFSLLSCSIEFCDPQTLINRGIIRDTASAVALSDRWHRLSECCLCMGDFLNQPNLNTVTTLLMLLDSFCSRGNVVGMLSLLALTIRLGQWLGFHRLGSARDDQIQWLNSNVLKDTPNEKVSKELLKNIYKSNVLTAFNHYSSNSSKNSSSFLSTDKSHLNKEAARRVWSKLLSFDYYISSDSEKMSYQVNVDSTGQVLNLDEEDLPNGPEESSNYAILPREKPLNVPTHAFGVRVYDLVNKGCKKVTDLKAMPGSDSPSTIREMDSIFRSIFDEIPNFLRLDGVSETLPEVIAQHQSRRHLTIARLILYQDLYERLINVHHPYMSLGHHDPEYKSSTEACVKSAAMIVYIRKELHIVAPTVSRYWFFKLTLFNALVVLCLHLIENARAGSNDRPDIREKIFDGLELLQAGRSIRETSKPENSSRIIDGLLRAEGIRRSTEDNFHEGSFLDLVSKDDPLNQYIDQLIDPNRNCNVPPPDDLFGLLDDLLPKG